MKHCSSKDCPNANPQELASFTKDPRNKDGLQSQCKTCKYASNSRWAAANQDKIKAYEASDARKVRHKETTYAWRSANQEKYNAYMRAHHKANYSRDRLYRYDLSREDYNLMLQSQQNRCALCNKVNPSTKRALAIDHDHATGEVRGLLCYKCNRDMVAIDDREHLAKCIAYRDKAHAFKKAA